MRVDLATTGLCDPSQLSAWTAQRRAAIRLGLKRGLQAGGRDVREAARSRMRSAFNVKRSGFVSSMRAKVLDRRTDRLPALWVGSKIPWLGVHEQGGTVSGNLLIPLLPDRMGPKRFKAVIDGLMRSGNAYFIEKNGRVLLMAENLRENAAQLNRFKRAERGRTGARRISRGQEIPIAVLVKSVSIRRRLDLAGTVQRALPRLVGEVQRSLARG